jgi:hypothetical protein
LIAPIGFERIADAPFADIAPSSRAAKPTHSIRERTMIWRVDCVCFLAECGARAAS